MSSNWCSLMLHLANEDADFDETHHEIRHLAGRIKCYSWDIAHFARHATRNACSTKSQRNLFAYHWHFFTLVQFMISTCNESPAEGVCAHRKNGYYRCQQLSDKWLQASNLHFDWMSRGLLYRFGCRQLEQFHLYCQFHLQPWTVKYRFVYEPIKSIVNISFFYANYATNNQPSNPLKVDFAWVIVAGMKRVLCAQCTHKNKPQKCLMVALEIHLTDLLTHLLFTRSCSMHLEITSFDGDLYEIKSFLRRNSTNISRS